MDFELSEEQQLMRSGLRELLERACDIRHVRAVAYDSPQASDADLWRALADAGWTAVAVPEADGGAGLRFEDVALVIEQAGRAVLPAPLTTTLLASRSIARSPETSIRSDLLARIVSGEASVTLALRGSPNDWNGERPSLTAERSDEGWRLSGTSAFVPYGPEADVVLTEAETRHGRALVALPTSEAASTGLQTMDPTAPQYEIALDGVVVPPDASLLGDTDASEEIDRLVDEWRVALAAETLGACERALELSVAYAKDRVQFDRPIGSNQAVKARIAEMAGTVERMRAAVYHAAVKIDAEAPDRVLAVAMAKAATATPGAWVASQAIHVHGGIGYTWEHDLHLYFKRIKANELLLGDGMASLARVADAVL
ncbi:MAG: acyl-CoA dehydrogenase family protein [Dehalococcoidia bacterium]